MDKVTSYFRWVERRLDEGGWVRRTYLVVATVMLWRIQDWAIIFVVSKDAARFTGTDLAAIIAAVSVPASMVAKFAFDTYIESRKKPNDNNS